MTSIEWLIEELTPSIALQQKYIDELKEQAKQMHKQEIIDAYDKGEFNDGMNESAEQYYTENYTDNYPELFVSKGSDNTPKEVKKDSFGEISDEEIEKEAEKRSKSFNGFTTYEKSAWVMACKWYREQLKSKQL